MHTVNVFIFISNKNASVDAQTIILRRKIVKLGMFPSRSGGSVHF